MQERIYEVQSSFHQGTPGAGGAAAPSAPDKFLFDAVYSGGPPLGAGPRCGAGQQPVHRRGLFSAVGGHGLPGGVLSASPYPVRGVGGGQLLCRPVPGDAGAPLGSDRPGDGGGGVGELLLLPHRPHAGRDRPGGPSGLAPAAQIPGGPLSHRPAHRPPPLSLPGPGRLLPEPGGTYRIPEPVRRGDRRVGSAGGLSEERRGGRLSAQHGVHGGGGAGGSVRPAAELDHGPGGASGGDGGERRPPQYRRHYERVLGGL